MAKCKDCGFLAVWDLKQNHFVETSEHCRRDGYPEGSVQNVGAYQVKCFVQKANLAREVSEDPEHIYGYARTVQNVVKKDRICNGETPWIQGFHPKEHQEMLLNDERLKRQQRHATISLMVATFAAILTVVGTLIGAYINSNSAQLGAEATITAAKLQIEAQKEIGRQVQPINVTVQIPDTKRSK